MDVKTEKAVVVRLTPEEAGVLMTLTSMIGGPQDSLGRSVATSFYKALESIGVIGIDAFENDSDSDRIVAR